jgi:hypothetical protein
MLHHIKFAVKYLLAPILYRHAPFGLAPERLAIYLSCLLEKFDVAGDVAEIGCNICGTSVIASSIVHRYSPNKQYICYDTFGGFVDEQFDSDVEKGTAPHLRRFFSANSERLARRILKIHDRNDVIFVKADATKLRDSQLRDSYSVILIDVDLSGPTYEILKLFYPRLVKRGIILVDDCIEGHPDWKAIDGYRKFCKEVSIGENYTFGFGIVEKG